jgi:hypothetical protein
MPQGVIFEKTERTGDDWILTFAAKQYKENTSYSIWRNNYYDEQGKEYIFNSWSSRESAYGVNEFQNNTDDAPDVFYAVIPLKDYPYDTVYMSPEFSRIVELSEPVVIKIK